MRNTFEKLNDAYAKYYSPTEHLAIDEVIVLLRLESLSNNIFQRNIKCLGYKFTNCVIL
jgi:hypothetical protein